MLSQALPKLLQAVLPWALGGYLAGKTEQDHYKSEVKREYDEVENLRHTEIAETKEFFANIGLSAELQEKAQKKLQKIKTAGLIL